MIKATAPHALQDKKPGQLYVKFNQLFLNNILISNLDYGL